MGGRPKGRPNTATLEIRQAARELLENREYRKSLQRRLVEGKAPHMETLLFHYAYGKPKNPVELTGQDGPAVIQLISSVARPDRDSRQTRARFSEPAPDQD